MPRRAPAALPCLCALLPAGAAAGAGRSVDWWLGSYTDAYVAQNARFVVAERDVVTGGLFFGAAGLGVNATGGMVPPRPDLFANLTAGDKALGVSPVLLSLSPNPAAVQGGVAARAVPDLVDVIVQAGVDGYVTDYEPHDNTTEAHARAYAAFLTALAAGLHGAGKQLAVCVSDWGILSHYDILAAAGADRYVSMGSTYKHQFLNAERSNVQKMLKAFPLETVTVGLGTMVPAACGCVYGNTGNCTGDYKWDEASLSAFVSWVGEQGVSHLAPWRADIYPAYCVDAEGKDAGVEPWTFPILRSFLSPSS